MTGEETEPERDGRAEPAADAGAKAASPDPVRVVDLDAGSETHPFGEREPRTVHLSLDAGESVAPHDHPGRDVLFLVREGRVDLTVDGESTVLESGAVARFPGEREVAPEALAATRALVVLAPRPE